VSEASRGDFHQMTELRKFGFIFSGYYLAVTLLILFRHHSIAPVAWDVLAVTFICTLIAPTLLTPLKWLWDKVLACLNYVNTRILFGILFFVVFTPIALCKKALRKDAMCLHTDASAKTYRVDCTNMQNDLRRPY